MKEVSLVNKKARKKKEFEYQEKGKINWERVWVMRTNSSCT